MDKGGRKSLTSVSGSPKSPAQKGNLTGSARILNDTLVSFHNTIQKWNLAYHNGVRLLQNIQQKNLANQSDDFQSSCEQLGEIVDVLRNQTAQLLSLTEKLKIGSELQQELTVGTSSWSYQNFMESAETLASAYFIETERKKKVAEIVKEFSPLSGEFEVLVLAWIQLTALGPEQDMVLKALQYEAGLGVPTWE